MMLHGASHLIPGMKIIGTGTVHPRDRETQTGHLVLFQDTCVSFSVAVSQVSALATDPLPVPSNPTTSPQHQTTLFFLRILFTI